MNCVQSSLLVPNCLPAIDGIVNVMLYFCHPVVSVMVCAVTFTAVDGGGEPPVPKICAGSMDIDIDAEPANAQNESVTVLLLSRSTRSIFWRKPIALPGLGDPVNVQIGYVSQYSSPTCMRIAS